MRQMCKGGPGGMPPVGDGYGYYILYEILYFVFGFYMYRDI